MVKILKFRNLSSWLTITLISFNVLNAQEQSVLDKESWDKLDTVIISIPNLNKTGTTPIPLIRKDLNYNTEGVNSLGDILATIPGVNQKETGRGVSKPVIRGLSGNRVVTYAQGVRVENQQWGSDHGLGVGFLGLSRVEVIKGPSSLLYGSDALGGVLYFIDEPYADKDHVSGFARSHFISNSLGSRTELGIKTNVTPIKWNVYGAFESHADYDAPESSKRIFNTRFKEQNLKTALGYKLNSWTTDLKYDFLKNKIGIVEEEKLYDKSTSRTFNAPYQDVTNHQVSWNNTYQLNQSKIEATLGYTNNNRKEFEEEHPDEEALDLTLQTYTYDAKWHVPLKDDLGLVIGSQGMIQDNENSGEERLIPNAETKDLGFFSFVNKDFNKLQVQGGFRWGFREIDAPNQSWEADGSTETFEKLNRTFNSINYSLGANYKLSSVKLTANISSGFRAPNTSELLADGAHHGTGRFIRGDENLDNEYATQIDLGINYDTHPLHLSANIFYNNIENYIYQSPTGTQTSGLDTYNYTQTDAQMFGGELGYHYHPESIGWLHLEQNFSMVWAQDKNNDPLPLIPPAQIDTKISSQFKGSNKFHLNSVFAKYSYHFRQHRTATNESDSPDYGLTSIGASFKKPNPKYDLSLSLGANNLTDEKYIDHLSGLKSQGASGPGFGVFIKVGISFNKPVKTDSKTEKEIL